MQNSVGIKDLRRNSDYWGWVEHDGYKMFLGKNDCGVAMRLKAGLGYEPESMKLWESLCKDAELVVDIGAHTGIYSVSAFKSGAKNVCSIEPFYLNCARLDMNLRANGFRTSGVLLGCALDEDGYAEFSVRSSDGYCTTGGKVGVKKNATDVHLVRCVRLDSYIKESFHSLVGPIKIDVEMSAKRVLAGMPKILSNKPNLLIEVTESGLTEILKPYGYRFYMLDDENGTTEVDSLEPVLLEDGTPDLRRLNRWCR